MLTDLDCANLCQSLYNGESIFSYGDTIEGVTFAVKSYEDCFAVVFEGSHNIPDWISNFKAVMQYIPDFGGVEAGFYDGIPAVAVKLLPDLPKDKTIFITGHSRGAAHAHIFAAILIKHGYKVEVVVFGSPRPGDARLAAILAKAPNRSYRNYKDFDEQDFVCDVPFCIALVFPFVHPAGHRTIDIAPPPNDPWLLLARHHMSLYQKALQA